MSARLEQTAEELDFLVGATVERVEVRPDGFGGDAMHLHLRTKVEVVDGPTRGHHVDLEVWQDVEGNGPGYLALVEIRP